VLNIMGGLIVCMSLQARIVEAIQAAIDRGMSITDIARKAGVTPSAVSQWKDGTIKSLKAESAAGLEDATGYRAAWLSTGKGSKFSNTNWPFLLFNEADYRLLDEYVRQEIEDSIAGKIQRAKMTRGNGSTGRPYT
jgi:transcriptional regulator with XRE-family HTH domain